jgi:acyl-CoA thioester hydrolase
LLVVLHVNGKEKLMVSEKFSKIIRVKKVHLDALKHVNNVVFLQWVQDMAAEHWQSKSNKDFDAAYYWVVLDHYIEYKGQAFLDDELTVQTFVERNEGLRSTRVVEFLREGKLLVKAKTNWCLINRLSHRPVRIPEEIDRMFFTR